MSTKTPRKGPYKERARKHLARVKAAAATTAQQQVDLTNARGYITLTDNTEILTWTIRQDGGVECVHAAPAACTECIDADHRLAEAVALGDSDTWTLA